MKKIIVILAVLVLLIAGFYMYRDSTATNEQPVAAIDDTTPEPTVMYSDSYKDASYMIDGQLVQLRNGSAETEAAPGSATKITTDYFGNELRTDLNNDGREDVVFILTQETGGSGTFFYAVAALNTEKGYIGSDGYLLGDRIAPQSTDESQNPRQKNVVVFNYFTRAQDEPMTATPSIGVSAYLKLVPETMQWAVVEPNFEGESR